MTYNIACLKTRVLLDILLCSLFFSLIVNYRSVSTWERKALFSSLEWLYSFSCSSADEPLVSEELLMPSVLSLVQFCGCFSVILLRVLLPGCRVLTEPHSSTRRALELIAGRGTRNLIPSACSTERSRPGTGGAPSQISSSAEQGHAGAQCSFLPSFHTTLE